MMAELIVCPLCRQKNFQVVFSSAKRQIVKCLNDGLVFVNPQPSPAQLGRLYDPNYFQNREPYLKFGGMHQSYFRQKLRQVETRTKSKGKLLDVGCGWGWLLAETKKRGWLALGVDPAEAALRYCRSQGLKVQKSLAGIPSGTVDVITSLQTIEHETNPLAHLAGIRRLLKNDGLLVLTTPNYNSWTRKLIGKYWFGYRHLEHLYFFSPAALRNLLIKAGFRQIEIKRDDVRTFRLSYYLEQLASFYPSPFVKRAVNMIKGIIGNLPAPIPTDPWGDILVFARK